MNWQENRPQYINVMILYWMYLMLCWEIGPSQEVLATVSLKTNLLITTHYIFHKMFSNSILSSNTKKNIDRFMFLKKNIIPTT
jgi:hypothetical protein